MSQVDPLGIGPHERLDRLNAAIERARSHGDDKKLRKFEAARTKLLDAFPKLRTGPEIDWKKIALYLADCHAATAEYEGRLSRTSKSSAERMRNICLKTADMIEGKQVPEKEWPGYQGRVLKRLREASDPNG